MNAYAILASKDPIAKFQYALSRVHTMENVFKANAIVGLYGQVTIAVLVYVNKGNVIGQLVSALVDGKENFVMFLFVRSANMEFVLIIIVFAVKDIQEYIVICAWIIVNAIRVMMMLNVGMEVVLGILVCVMIDILGSFVMSLFVLVME